MDKIRKWWVGAAAAAAVAAAIGVGAGVMAQTPVPDADTGTSMLDRVAQKLGISSDTLSEAIETSALEEVDERMAAGDLTKEEADAIKERIAELPDDALIGPGGRGGFGPGGHHGRGEFAFRLGYDFGFGRLTRGEGLAEFLGTTVDDLAMELRVDGATLAAVAEAHGKSRDELKAFLTGELQAKLDDRVAAGDLTQAQADEIIAHHGEMLDAVIDGELPAGRGFRHPLKGSREGRPDFGHEVPSAEPTSTATDSSVS